LSFSYRRSSGVGVTRLHWISTSSSAIGRMTIWQISSTRTGSTERKSLTSSPRCIYMLPGKSDAVIMSQVEGLAWSRGCFDLGALSMEYKKSPSSHHTSPSTCRPSCEPPSPFSGALSHFVLPKNWSQGSLECLMVVWPWSRRYQTATTLHRPHLIGFVSPQILQPVEPYGLLLRGRAPSNPDSPDASATHTRSCHIGD